MKKWLNHELFSSEVVADNTQEKLYLYTLDFHDTGKCLLEQEMKWLFEEIIISGITIGLLVFGLWFYLIKHIGMDPVIARGYTMALMIIIQNILSR